MEQLLAKAKQFKYNSMEYLEAEDIISAKEYKVDDDCILLYESKPDKVQLHWAADTKEAFLSALSKILLQLGEQSKKLYVEFIPEEFLEGMEALGFVISSEFKDYWKRELAPQAISPNPLVRVRRLAAEEAPRAREITELCVEKSRGFFGVAEQDIKQLLECENSCVLAAEQDGRVIGVAMLNLYGFESEKGTILWFKVLAVDPAHHNKGIGRLLIEHALNWGYEKGAKRSFLASDAENANAVKLYNSYGYVSTQNRGQINLEKVIR